MIACDVALIGTGLAPLVTALHLISQHKTVALLNPDWDFFQEDSELQMDPLWPLELEGADARRIAVSSLERAAEILKPSYPGALQIVAGPRTDGFHDPLAPHLRGRDRVWVRSERAQADDRHRERWGRLEEMFVHASDAGFHPQEISGALLGKHFPGTSGTMRETVDGILLPRLADVDVERYRIGVMEYVLERVGPQGWFRSVSELERDVRGLRFFAQGRTQSLTVRENIALFWTPRLTPWVRGAFEQEGMKKSPLQPLGMRDWEEWSLVSRSPLDSSSVGIFEDLIVWSDFEGSPHQGSERLKVMRAGERVSAFDARRESRDWAGAGSFESLSRLCQEFMEWEGFAVRGLRARRVFEWGEAQAVAMRKKGVPLHVIPRSDGAIVPLVAEARALAEALA